MRNLLHLLHRLLPIGPYTPKHWLDTDHRGAWLIPLCLFVGVGVPYLCVVWAVLNLHRG